MDGFTQPNITMTVTLWLFILILNAEEFVLQPQPPPSTSDEDDIMDTLMEWDERPCYDTMTVMQNTLLNFRLCASLNVYHDEMLYWVKPRSTTWFSKFLMEQYDQSRWVSMFRMTKPALFALAEIIRPHVEKKNTRYRLAVPVLVRVACTLFKLSHGVNFTICSELFAIDKSTISKILREVVNSINDCLKQEISWPRGQKLRDTQRKFASLCSLPAVVGALDGVHIAIAKPRDSPVDYYYFKSGGYSINCQAVVDSDKSFLDLCVGMLGSTNDSRVLRRSSLFNFATHGTLFDPPTEVDGFSPYLIVDGGYPLLPWLMTPHREQVQLPLSDATLNRKLKKGRVVVENAFGILKQTFRELLGKSDLHVTFLPDVVVCCATLHNILLRQSHEDVEELLRVLNNEGEAPNDDVPIQPVIQNRRLVPHQVGAGVAAHKRQQLGVYLTERQRLRHQI